MINDNWRLGIARVFDTRKETINEAKQWVRECIIRGARENRESKDLVKDIDDEKIASLIETRYDTSDDDTFARLEGWIVFGKLKELCVK